jgi:hypothetical protein
VNNALTLGEGGLTILLRRVLDFPERAIPYFPNFSSAHHILLFTLPVSTIIIKRAPKKRHGILPSGCDDGGAEAVSRSLSELVERGANILHQ